MTASPITDLMIARLEEVESAKAADRKEAQKFIRAKLENTFDKSFLDAIETGEHEVFEYRHNLKAFHRFTGRGSLNLLSNTAHFVVTVDCTTFVDDNAHAAISVALGTSPVFANAAAASDPQPDTNHCRVYGMTDLVDLLLEWDASQGLDGE
jgi:hypothetical protein